MKKRNLLLAALCAAVIGCMPAVSMAEEVEPVSEEAQEAVEDAIEELGERPTYKALDHVTLGEYTDLPVQVEEIVITDDQVRTAIARVAASAGKMETLTEGVVQYGDVANIDYEGKKDGVAFDGGTSQGFDLEIGSGTFIPGFEDGLVDVKIGDTVDLDLTFPEEYHNADLEGAAVVFTVKVNSVQRVPELTDTLVNELSGGAYSTVDGFKDYVKKSLETQTKAAQENGILNELMTQLYNTCKVNDYPPELVDYSIAEMTNYYKDYARSNNMEFSEFLQNELGLDEEAYKAEAEASVKAGLEQELILMAIAEQENLTDVSGEEFEKGCERYAAWNNMTVDDFKAQYDETRIRNSIIVDKAMDFVRTHALEVTEEESEAVNEAVTEAATEAATE